MRAVVWLDEATVRGSLGGLQSAPIIHPVCLLLCYGMGRSVEGRYVSHFASASRPWTSLETRRQMIIMKMELISAPTICVCEGASGARGG